MPEFVCKFNNDYENFLGEVYQYVVSNFANDFDLSDLKTIEIVDSLPGSSDGRIDDTDTILLNKRYYELLPHFDIRRLKSNDNFNSIISTLYHELCHINEQKIMPNLHAICYEPKEEINYCVALFWIEYVVETKTNVNLKRDKSDLCNAVASRKWNINKFNFNDADDSNYFYLIKVLSYVLACFQSREISSYLEKIKNYTVRKMVAELYNAISKIKVLYPFDDIKNLCEIKHVFLKYKEQFIVA